MLTEFRHEPGIAFRQFEFAVRMLSYVKLGKRELSDFDVSR